VRGAGLILLTGALWGCGASPVDQTVDAGRRDTGARTDRGVAADTGPTPGEDTDRDGLCDRTEGESGTDPTRADTDGDGLTDLFELRAGDDPRNPNDPLAVDRVQLREAPEEVVINDYAVVIDGAEEGDVITALWQDRGVGVDDRLASAWVSFDLAALSADPAGVVDQISGPRFVGVRGRARLTWRLTARSRGGAADGDAGVTRLGCRRAYEFVLAVFAAGGDALRVRRMTLDVIGARTGGTWPDVDAEGFCQPAQCL